MKISPVRTYRSPKYPLRDLFIDQPQLLNRYTPSSWKGKTIVAGALAAFILCGCSTDKASDPSANKNQMEVLANVPTKSPTPDIQQSAKPEKSPQQSARKIKKPDVVSVAPVFIHGEGRGATGCVVISPPVFITEEEACQIISEEMKKDGITFNRSHVPIREITFQYEDWPDGKKSRALEMDGVNDKYNIGYHYVTQGNYFFLGGEGSGSTVQRYDFKAVAESLRKKLSDYGKINAVVFYDPCSPPSKSDPPDEGTNYFGVYGGKNLNSNSREQIKAQVRDFLEWMKDRSKG